MQDASLDRLIAKLHRESALRASSLIITFFGDAIAPRGGAVSLATVRRLMARFNIEDGAVRTALSRLAGDGWVERVMRGRTSHYRLSDQGRAPFETATRRIYAGMPVKTGSNGWLVAIGDSRDPVQAERLPPGAVAISSHVILVAAPPADLQARLDAEGWLTVIGRRGDVPPWVALRVMPPASATAFQGLMRDVDDLASCMPMEGAEAMAARCLIIHAWRRLLLRVPDMPAALLPEDWPGEACRARLARLYHALLPPSENWLDANATGPDGPLPASGPKLNARFRREPG